MTQRLSQANKIGLAFGGGGVLGAVHIGVLHALEEQDIHPACLAGSSIGALISALYAFDMSWQDIHTQTKKLDWLDVAEVKLSRLGLLSNAGLKTFVDNTIGDVSFEQANIPLGITATDLTNGERIVLTQGNVASAIMASTCIPGVFEPVEIDGQLLVDGGIVENVPISLLTEMGADFTIGVDLSLDHSAKKPNNIVEVMMHALKFSMIAAAKLQREDVNLCIAPDLSRFNMFDNKQFDDLVEVGYQAAKQQLSHYDM